MNLLSRITKIESAIAAVPRGAVLLHEPPVDADDGARETFQYEIREAIDSGSTVIVVRNGDEYRLRQPGVTYVPNEFEGQLELAAATPDPIHGNRLRAILHQCRNTALPVVAEVSDAEI